MSSGTTPGVTWSQVTTGVTNIFEVVGTVLTKIVENPFLLAIFVSSIIFVALRLIKKIKKAAR